MRQAWYDSFHAEKECTGCRALRHEFRLRPIDVEVERKPDSSALNFAGPSLIGIIRREFLRLFESEARKHLNIGRVFDRHGNVLIGFVSFVGEKPLPIRGGPESDHRICEACGRFVYSPDSRRYFMRSDLTGQPLYYVSPCGLAMTAGLVERIDRRIWKGIWIEKLPVRDIALDGIEHFPEYFW